ncbi:DNA cytosine methyltransferase [Nocardia neocaledoniensis]|uniref:DNA cytosine methyltransferase n=1 Tax=Nocardia neocaledoniensis TaxID=236511 RepID=UPI002453AF98|nr:DNA cytosine methyltransferase [Nocardia neocaledoniensis]
MPSAAPEIPVVDMVDLFAGPGGLDVAAKWLGIKTVGIEFDANACATRTAAELGTVMADVTDCMPSDYPAKVLAGGPPCQTYSVAGNGAGRERLDHIRDLVHRMGDSDSVDVAPELSGLDDVRTGLVLEPLKWALQAERRGCPYDTIVLEQVPTVLPVWEAYAEVLKQNGYDADAKVLCAEEYGVPQTRRRAILIARRDGAVLWPDKTHQKFVRGGRAQDDAEKQQRWVSMQRALGREDEFVVISNYGTGGVSTARGERRFDEPAYTVTGKVSRNRIVDSRGKYVANLSSEDAGRLQTFPYDYPWSGLDVSQQIGNAIPPRLAAHVLCVAVFGQQASSEALDVAVSSSWKVTRQGVPGLRSTEPAARTDAEPAIDQDRQLALLERPALAV